MWQGRNPGSVGPSLDQGPLLQFWALHVVLMFCPNPLGTLPDVCFSRLRSVAHMRGGLSLRLQMFVEVTNLCEVCVCVCVCVYVCLSTCLSVCLSVCLSAFLSVLQLERTPEKGASISVKGTPCQYPDGGNSSQFRFAADHLDSHFSRLRWRRRGRPCEYS